MEGQRRGDNHERDCCAGEDGVGHGETQLLQRSREAEEIGCAEQQAGTEQQSPSRIVRTMRNGTKDGVSRNIEYNGREE